MHGSSQLALRVSKEEESYTEVHASSQNCGILLSHIYATRLTHCILKE
jgi:hypothetical protein